MSGKIQPITEERWQQAQKAEREFHDGRGLEQKLEDYAKFYRTCLRLLDIDRVYVRNVLEVGCADIPLLHYHLQSESSVCEPMPSPILHKICHIEKISMHYCKFEDLEEPSEQFNEVWIFNVMQHIQDPEKFIEKAKRIGKSILFFEPIDWPIEIYHPFSYTLDDYKRWFGDCVQFYKGGSIKGFHEANCAYGVWRQPA